MTTADTDTPPSHTAADAPRWAITHMWGGESQKGARGATIERLDPYNDAPIGSLPCAEPVEVRAAVVVARSAAAAWAAMPAAERADGLREAANRIEQRRDELAQRQVHEMGKPIGDAAGGVDAAVGTIRQFAELGALHRGQTLQGEPGALDSIHHVPRGVAAVITPWNDPVAIAAQGIAANLAVGNTVICKPSERASFSVAGLVEAFEHLPAGVVNLVLGDATTGSALVDEDIDVVVFTGSVRAGRSVAGRCAPRFVHTVLELGGNDPLIVDDGVDPEWAAEQIATGAFANGGQICVAVERVFVHRAVADPVIDALVRQAEERRLGSGLDPETELAPLADHDHVRSVHDHVIDAVERGAICRTGGAPLDRPGAFYPPTVLTDVPENALVLQEETFGPVVPVVVVDDFDEGVRRAAASEYGLAATVLTPHLSHAQDAWRRLPVGTVKINAVFGGAPGGSADPHGASGTGLGFGPGLLDELTRQRVVHLGPSPRPR